MHILFDIFLRITYPEIVPNKGVLIFMTSLDSYLDTLPALALPHQDKLRGGDGLFLIETQEGRSFCLRLADGLLTVSPGTWENPDCTLRAKESLLLDLLTQKANPITALMLGKVKISGNKGLLLKLISAL